MVQEVSNQAARDHYRLAFDAVCVNWILLEGHLTGGWIFLHSLVLKGQLLFSVPFNQSCCGSGVAALGSEFVIPRIKLVFFTKERCFLDLREGGKFLSSLFGYLLIYDRANNTKYIRLGLLLQIVGLLDGRPGLNHRVLVKLNTLSQLWDLHITLVNSHLQLLLHFAVLFIVFF